MRRPTTGSISTISGAETRGLSVLFAGAFALAAVFNPGPARAESWGLPALMRSLAQLRAASADFTESKTMPLLTKPLESTGRLRYVAPDFIQKTVLQPSRQDFVLKNDRVTLTANGETHDLTLDQAPQIAGLVAALRDTLAGDLADLQRYYRLDLSGGPEAWQLLLKPRAASLARFVAWVSIRGSGDLVTEIDTGGAKGDLTRMSVHETPSHAP